GRGPSGAGGGQDRGCEERLDRLDRGGGRWWPSLGISAPDRCCAFVCADCLRESPHGGAVAARIEILRGRGEERPHRLCLGGGLHDTRRGRSGDRRRTVCWCCWCLGRQIGPGCADRQRRGSSDSPETLTALPTPSPLFSSGSMALPASRFLCEHLLQNLFW